MSIPKRIQRKRTKGWRMPVGSVYVGRTTKWGNPFKVGIHGDAGECVAFYRQTFEAIRLNTFHKLPARFQKAWREHHATWLPIWIDVWVTSEAWGLRGKDLACFCRLDAPCHADVLLELANR